MQILQYSGNILAIFWQLLCNINILHDLSDRRVAQDDGDTCLISTKNRQTGWIYNNDFWLLST